MRCRLVACLALLVAAPALASLEEDGAWAGGVWDPGAWADGVWLEAAPTVAVPDCSGLDEAACIAAVEGEGFVAAVASACSATVAMGDVIATAPPAGAEASEGSAVVIRVSNGEECKNGQGSRLGLGLGVTR